MTDLTDANAKKETKETSSGRPPDRRSFWASAWRHRSTLARGLAVLLLVTIVLQNVEPTKIDVLFWTLPAAPKLVVILSSMVVGAVCWELARRAVGGAGKQD